MQYVVKLRLKTDLPHSEDVYEAFHGSDGQDTIIIQMGMTANTFESFMRSAAFIWPWLLITA